MELQLGLGLPGNSIKGFDLNSLYGGGSGSGSGSGFASKDVFGSCSTTSLNVKKNRKRSFESMDHHSPCHHDHLDVDVPQTLPLLVDWNNNNNLLSDQDDNINDDDLDAPTCKINEGEESGVIGWPPVKSWRKKACQGQQKHGESKSMYVKVKMEGVGIARKVDLTLHSSYDTLTNALMPMFGKCEEDVKSYNLTYQDKEGDWLLAGDVPWGAFVETVQRLKVLKKGA